MRTLQVYTQLCKMLRQLNKLVTLERDKTVKTANFHYQTASTQRGSCSAYSARYFAHRARDSKDIKQHIRQRQVYFIFVDFHMRIIPSKVCCCERHSTCVPTFLLSCARHKTAYLPRKKMQKCTTFCCFYITLSRCQNAQSLSDMNSIQLHQLVASMND